jgi:hypothetical protein
VGEPPTLLPNFISFEKMQLPKACTSILERVITNLSDDRLALKQPSYLDLLKTIWIKAIKTISL